MCNSCLQTILNLQYKKHSNKKKQTDCIKQSLLLTIQHYIFMLYPLSLWVSVYAKKIEKHCDIKRFFQTLIVLFGVFWCFILFYFILHYTTVVSTFRGEQQQQNVSYQMCLFYKNKREYFVQYFMVQFIFR